MSMPTPPTDAGPSPAPAPAPAPQAPTPPVNPAPQAPTPPAPQWTPPPAVPAPPVPAPPAQAVDDGSRDISRLPQWAQKEIQDLRGESAKYRVSARTATVAQHAFAAAPTLGVNGHALLSSIPFQQAAAELDPNAADFATQLTTRVTEILAANPWMAAAPASPPAPPTPTVSGGEFAGAPGEGQPITEEQLARMTPDQIEKAFAAGKLKHLM
ncbi:hypothetical protein ACIBG7_18640 [Nonomuraea sp. NPDC050328]|uniref:hypothetical protein n=1 Tax=Nonomuraea sp. NPDC050328 TaxID=3364361 RepID=UPI00378F0BC8